MNIVTHVMAEQNRVAKRTSDFEGPCEARLQISSTRFCSYLKGLNTFNNPREVCSCTESIYKLVFIYQSKGDLLSYLNVFITPLFFTSDQCLSIWTVGLTRQDHPLTSAPSFIVDFGYRQPCSGAAITV